MMKKAILTVAVLMATAAMSHAALIIDVVVVGGGKSVNVTTVGQTVHLEIYARVTGTNPSLVEGFQAVEGTLRSAADTASTIMGNLGSGAMSAPFNAGRVGTNMDVDGDTDLDYGQLGVNNGDADLMWARSATMTDGSTDGTSSFLLGTAVWTCTQLGADSWINFVIAPVAGLNKNPTWKEDGVQKNASSSGVSLGVGSPVLLVPEPATIGLLLVGGVGALLRRRR